MEIAILLYNIVITAVLALSMACAYYLFKRRRSPTFLAVGVMFLLYLMDNTVVLCTEIIPSFSESYDTMFISTPSFKTVYFAGLLACVLYIYLSAMKPSERMGAYAAFVFYVAALICIPMVPESRWMVWLYYLPTQIFLGGIGLSGLLRMRRGAEHYERPFFKLFRKLLIFLFVMALAILAEDTLVIFHFDIYSAGSLKINNRSWTENILFLGLACFFIKYTIAELERTELRFRADPRRSAAANTDPYSAFGETCGLTERECEILMQLLEGKSQQEISDELMIAPGTVKTHIHNIYQKMDVAKRSQLMAKYQRFIESVRPEQDEP